MHKVEIPSWADERALTRRGRLHPFDDLDPARTSLVVVDLQNGFMAPGQPAEVAQAREIVPNVNRLAGATRAAGGTVVWIQNTITPETEKSWSVWFGHFAREEWGPRMRQAFSPGDFGHALYPELEVAEGDLRVRKTRFSALIQGSSDLDIELRPRHRHADRCRHRDECLLRVDGTRRNDAELQSILRVGCERLSDRLGGQRDSHQPDGHVCRYTLDG